MESFAGLDRPAGLSGRDNGDKPAGFGRPDRAAGFAKAS